MRWCECPNSNSMKLYCNLRPSASCSLAQVELKLVQRPQGRQVVWYGTGPGPQIVYRASVVSWWHNLVRPGGNGNLMLETSLGALSSTAV